MAFKPENLPDHRAFEGRFSFIDDETFRTNVLINFQYIFTLISLTEEFDFQGTIVYSINKDIIVNTAAIIECSLYHCIRKYFETGTSQETECMEYEWKDLGPLHLIHKISEDEKIFWTVKKKKFTKFAPGIQFITINRIARKLDILDAELFDKAEKLRENRNKIHLAALDSQRDFFEKKHVEESFNNAKDILSRIEERLISLQSS